MRRAFTLRGFATSTTQVRVRNQRQGGDLQPLCVNESKRLTWYSCGPTVYDAAHLGHARTYVAVDVIRRILDRHFGIQLVQAMGITNVDDKLINRAAESGSTVAQLAHKFESSFLSDMAKLNVVAPPNIARVSEYMSDIVAFVEDLHAKGFAYVGGDGAVYFDVQKYGNKYGVFANICNEDENNNTAVEEVKKDARDFALWKPMKADAECVWKGPLGIDGRPGWHIECSAFCRAIFGESLDVHYGGVDLAFPHHENEIAQCQALFGSTWGRVFVHAGHLHIRGRKMSKSLKNFVTIDEFLQQYSATQFRLFCLLHKYSANIEFSAERMADARVWEQRLVSFLASIDQHLRHVRSSVPAPSAINKASPDLALSLRGGEESKALQNRFETAKTAILESLANDFDTPSALAQLKELMGAVDVSMQREPISSPLLSSIADYVRDLVASFGLVLPSMQGGGGEEVTNASAEKKILEAAVELRRNVRNLALSSLKQPQSDKELAKQLLAICDDMRNKTMPQLGYALNDKKDGSCTCVPIVNDNNKE